MVAPRSFAVIFATTNLFTYMDGKKVQKEYVGLIYLHLKKAISFCLQLQDRLVGPHRWSHLMWGLLEQCNTLLMNDLPYIDLD